VNTPSREAAERLAALGLEREAEVDRFRGKLRDLRQAHAAEIARLRAEHAADIRRLVEALWDAQAVARAASRRAQDAAEMATSQPPPQPRPMRARARAWMARLAGRGGVVRRSCAIADRIMHERRVKFQAWR